LEVAFASCRPVVKPKNVYDIFLMSHEVDMVEVRVFTLADVVTKFVIVESNVSHSGLPKPLYFEANRGEH
jgi:beta-1,4-mannosyl-glycoprotein beta-1,4-N-acetylglucosaminyltransferase